MQANSDTTFSPLRAGTRDRLHGQRPCAIQQPRRSPGAGVARWLAMGTLAITAMTSHVGAAFAATASAHAMLADAERARRHADAVVEFRQQHFAVAYGRFAELADEGHAPSALLALAMVRHGPALFGGQWSASAGQLRRWSAMANSDLRDQAPRISGYERVE